jgi:orotate phosphoribosyltransferase
MVFNKESAYKTAEFLLKIKAIQLKAENPFTWASGWKSPIYCDNRITLSFPEIRTNLRQQMVRIIQEKYDNVQVIAGVATGAIALGVLIADDLGLPFVYVRPEPKGHGRQNQIEGFLEKGKRVLVIEDLISTGGSSLKAVDALRSASTEVLGMIAIFTYGFAISAEKFAESKCELITLSDYDHLLEASLKTGFISEKEHLLLSSWRLNPSEWTPNKK